MDTCVVRRAEDSDVHLRSFHDPLGNGLRRETHSLDIHAVDALGLSLQMQRFKIHATTVYNVSAVVYKSLPVLYSRIVSTIYAQEPVFRIWDRHLF
jgi:hypothetical protein